LSRPATKGELRRALPSLICGPVPHVLMEEKVFYIRNQVGSNNGSKSGIGSTLASDKNIAQQPLPVSFRSIAKVPKFIFSQPEK